MQKSCKFMSVWTGGTFIRWVIGLDYISLRREKFMLAEKVVWFVRVKLANFEWGHNLSRKHGCGWEGAAPASDAVARMAVPHLSFFFSLGFVPTWLDSRRTGFDSRWIGLIRPESGRIGHIGLYWPAIDTAEIGRKRPKSTLKLAGTAKILTSEVFLAFFFLCFVNQGIVMCFLRIF